MFIHSLAFVKNLRKCGHSLVFSIGLSFVRKLLRKIFFRAKIFGRKETHVREEKEKRKNYCTITFELHSIEYFVRLLFVWTNQKQRKMKDAYSKKDAQSNSLASKKVVEKALSSSLFSFIIFTQILFFSVFLFSRLFLLLKITRTTARRWCLLIYAILKTTILCLVVIFIWSHNST